MNLLQFINENATGLMIAGGALICTSLLVGYLTQPKVYRRRQNWYTNQMIRIGDLTVCSGGSSSVYNDHICADQMIL